MEIKPIGYISSCYKDKFGTPRQPGLVEESFGIIKILPEFQPQESLVGLDEFSHLWVLFHFHQNENQRFHAKVHPPRLKGKTMGLFATRTPHRPNPIGLSLVKIHKVEKDSVIVTGIDLVDNTPVLDIKPYLPFVESKPEAQGGWAVEAKDLEIEVIFSLDVANEIKNIQQQISKKNEQENSAKDVNLSKLIIETLKLDPRPIVYRGFEDSQNSPYRSQHAVRILDYDIHFEFITKNQIQVFGIFVIS